MSKNTKDLPKIELLPKGVFAICRHDKQLIAAPVRYEAVGTRVSDNNKVAEVSFVNFDGERLSETFSLSALLPRNRHAVVERLADKGYRWPTDKGLIDAILAALIANIPERRFKLVGAPGWYDGVYVTPDREYGSENVSQRSFLIDDRTGANVASLQLGTGSLKAWKRKVAKVAKKSCRLRLCIAAAFAAPVLRPLEMDSFGLNLYGGTSTGKTSCLVAAASVSGLIGERGLPGWADSEAAIEQLLVGHRDGLVTLDETGDGKGKMSLAYKARSLAFAIVRNRPRNLDRGYEKTSKLTTRDRFNIVLSSSERALGSIAMAEGSPRLGGEEVRLIDVPATEPGSQGIFDGSLKSMTGRSPADQGKRTVDRLRKYAVVNQGFALDAFLRKYTKDTQAVSTLKQYLREFETHAGPSMARNSDHRIRSNFAVMYAAAALAIDYGIVPWTKTLTLKAIAKCMTATFEARLQLADLPSNAPSIGSVAKGLKEELECLDLVTINKGVRASAEEAQRRQQAQGFRVGPKLYVKPKCWNGLTTENKSVLIQHGILQSERNDTTTIARKISGVKGKPRYIVIDATALDEATRLAS